MPAPPAKKGMSVGLIAAIAVISLLVLAGLGVGIGYVVVSGDDDKPVATSTSAPPSAEPQKKKKKSSNDGGVENLVLEEDDVTDDLFPARLDGSRPPDYERIAHGKVSCDDATDSERLRKVFKEFGCEEVLVGAYVDEDKEVVVTIGYIKTDSKATAEKYHEECLDYRDKSMRPKMVVPKDSKIEKGYEAYYYTRATDEYITYTIVAYYDGRTPETIDTTMIQHSSAVAVRVEFDGRRP